MKPATAKSHPKSFHSRVLRAIARLGPDFMFREDVTVGCDICKHDFSYAEQLRALNRWNPTVTMKAATNHEP